MSKYSGKWSLILILIGIFLLIAWGGMTFYRMYTTTFSLVEKVDRLQLMASSGISELDLDEAEGLLEESYEDVAYLKRTSRPFWPLAPILGWLPKVGATIKVAPELLTMADQSTYASLVAFKSLKPTLANLQDDGDVWINLSLVLQQLSRAENEFRIVQESIKNANHAREQIEDSESLPIRIQAVLDQWDKVMPILPDGIDLALVLPELMGLDGNKKTYLIIAQNEDELRPTGGFISGAGLLEVLDGQIVAVSFDNANLIDDWSNKPYSLPPQPFIDFMGMDIFLFRDANFWPDFTVSAEKAMQLYSYGREVELNGIVAIDQRFVQELLRITGPVLVAELENNLDENNVIDEIRHSWGPSSGQSDWINRRKDFMGPLAEAVLSSLVARADANLMLDLFQMIQKNAEEAHFQVYVRDQNASKALANLGWDGRNQNRNGQDFLLIVDTNLGFNKVNPRIDRSVQYHVTLDDDESPIGELDVGYRNNSTADVAMCEHGTQYTAETQYEDLIDDCYWNYLRVYTPESTTLVEGSTHPLAESYLMSGRPYDGLPRDISSESGGHSVFSNFILVSPGEALTSTFKYILPNTIVEKEGNQREYTLNLNKQAGLDRQNTEVIVDLPEGSVFVSARPIPDIINGTTIVYRFQQTTNVTLSLLYR